MNYRLDLTNLNPQHLKRLKTLTKLMTKSSLLQNAPVTMVHNLSNFKCGQDYIFKSLDCGRRGFIQGYNGNIQPGDHLVLRNGTDTVRYQVEEIEPWAEPPNLWVAAI